MLGGQKLLRVVFQKAAKINQISALFEQYNNSEKIVINKSLKLKKNEIIRTKISSHLLTPDILTKIISKEPVIKPNGDRLCRKHSLSSGDNPVRFLNTSLFGQQSGRHLQNSIQRRLYATYDECGNCLDCDFDPLRPPCVEQPRTSPKEKCPPTIKREGCCCRVTMPGCKKSCRFQRKFCCIRLERPFKFCRQKTPSAAFSECRKPIIVLKTIPECTCLEGVSPCAHDRRPRKIPPPTKVCGK